MQLVTGVLDTVSPVHVQAAHTERALGVTKAGVAACA